MPNNEMDYSLIHRTPDGTGKILVTTPGSPDKGSWETEAELKTYVNQDVNAAINALNTRVTNIEETLMGENEITVQYPSDSTYPSLMPNRVPARALKFAEVLRFRGKSRAWNQLLNKDNFPASTTYNNGNIVYTNNGDGSITLRTTATTTADVTIALESVTPAKGAVSGHTYVFKGGASGIKFGTGNGAGINEQGTGYETVITFSSSISMGYLIPSGTTIATAITLYPLLRDLTLYFGGTIPSDAQTVADIQTNYPELLVPSDYGTSVVFPTYTGGVSKSNNLIDEADYSELALLTYADDYFSNTIADTRSFFQLAIQAVVSGSTQTLNQINVESVGRKSITFTTPSAKIETLVIKHNGSSRDFSARFEINLPVSTRMTLSMDVTGYNPTVAGGVRFGKLKLEEGATATDYTPYGAIDTLTFPSPISLKSAGAVAEEYYPESGRVTHPIGSYTFTGQEEWKFYPAPDNRFYVTIFANQIKKIAISEVGNIFLPPFVPKSASVQYSQHQEYSVASDSSGSLLIYVASWVDKTKAEVASLMAGKTITFELATPSADTYVDPILDPFIKVEGGGTVETIQTQTPIIDNCLDVTYDIIPQ